MDEQTTYLISRIRKIYAQHAKPGTWVSIADLRPEVGGTRSQQDEAFRMISRERDVSIVPESNQKIFRYPECRYIREGAVVIGNQEKHSIAIG